MAVEKLQRESARLSQIQDIAGARLTVGISRIEQDDVTAALQAAWPHERLVDRRANPSYGYRAVHVIIQSKDCAVEIQIRTFGQNLWAQLVEALADPVGRGIRYGLWPDDAGKLRDAVLELSEAFARVDECDAVIRGGASLSVSQELLHASKGAVAAGTDAMKRIGDELSALVARRNPGS